LCTKGANARLHRIDSVLAMNWRSEHNLCCASEIMSSDDEERVKALCQQTANETDPEKIKQLISEILAVLEANQKCL